MQSHPLQQLWQESIQISLSDLQQHVFGPLREPVDGGAVNNGRVLQDALPVRECLIEKGF